MRYLVRGFDDQGVALEAAARIARPLPNSAGQMRAIARATGYRSTIVNGLVTIEDDAQTNTMAGQLLRHGRA